MPGERPGGPSDSVTCDTSAPRARVSGSGPNGAGKSTLRRTIATLHAPDAGSIHLFRVTTANA